VLCCSSNNKKEIEKTKTKQKKKLKLEKRRHELMKWMLLIFPDKKSPDTEREKRRCRKPNKSEIKANKSFHPEIL